MQVSFEIYNADAVDRLKDANVLPDYSVNASKDLAYNREQVNSAVESAIIQGKSVDKVAEDLEDRLQISNRRTAIKTARTAITSAQNAGTLDSFYDAQDAGITIQKKWVATLDDRTRPSHQAMDGEIRDLDDAFSNGLQYPGDPSGDPSEVYWCRCTLTSYMPGINSEDQQERWSRDPETGERETTDAQTYKQWAEEKTAEETERNADIVAACVASGVSKASAEAAYSKVAANPEYSVKSAKTEASAEATEEVLERLIAKYPQSTQRKKWREALRKLKSQTTVKK